jgi:hypothetical protein
MPISNFEGSAAKPLAVYASFCFYAHTVSRITHALKHLLARISSPCGNHLKDVPELTHSAFHLAGAGLRAYLYAEGKKRTVMRKKGCF